MSTPAAQRGVALMTAIILVALAAVIAVGIAFSSAMAARRSVAAFSVEQGLLFAEGAEALAAYAFSKDSNRTQDTLAELWATPLPPTEIADGVSIAAQVFDETGKFNLNSLVKNTGEFDQDAIDQFTYLLGFLKIQSGLAEQLADWLDEDVLPLSQGAEDSRYMSDTFPHLTANTPITSISELMQLPGMTAADYQKLAPHVTALPPGTKLNSCTADGFVLDAMVSFAMKSPQTQYQTDPDLLSKQKKSCFPEKNVFTAPLNATQQQALDSRIGETSDYFRLSTVVRLGTTQFALYSLLFRENGSIRPIIRTYGTD